MIFVERKFILNNKCLIIILYNKDLIYLLSLFIGKNLLYLNYI